MSYIIVMICLRLSLTLSVSRCFPDSSYEKAVSYIIVMICLRLSLTLSVSRCFPDSSYEKAVSYIIVMICLRLSLTSSVSRCFPDSSYEKAVSERRGSVPVVSTSLTEDSMDGSSSTSKFAVSTLYFLLQSHVHGLSQQGVWVPFLTPKTLKRTPQDTQIFLCGISKNPNLKLIMELFISL